VKKWLRIVVRYILIWLVGTLLLVLLIPFFRVAKIKNELDSADRLLRTGHPREALAQLQRIEIWATLYPPLSQRLTGSAIRCQAKLLDIRSAEQLARDFQDRYGRGRRPSRNIWECLETFPDRLINSYLSQSAGMPGATRWLGYEVLLNELEQAGDTNRVEKLAGEILSRDPENSLAKRVQDALAAKREEESRKTATPSPSVEAIKSEPPQKRVDHIDLARKHVAAKQWDKAVEECDAALALDPENPDVAKLKRIAEARDRRWGCTRTLAKAYDAVSGKAVQELAPGALVEVSGIRNGSPLGELAICKVITDTNDPPILLVRMRDLDTKMGPLSSASEEEKTLRIRRVRLWAEIARLKDELLQSRLKDNPYKKEYDVASAAYNAYWTKVKNLQAKHQASTGDERVRVADEMKRLKGEDIRIGQALETAKKKMNEWQERNAASPIADPKLTALEEELAKLQSQIMSWDGKP
jgi:tetratricopeptide (TPR) repeat protein